MKILGRVLEARWFLLIITIGLCLMAGLMYSERDRLEVAPSTTDLQRSAHAQGRIKVLVPGRLGESIAEAMDSQNQFQVAHAAFASATRNVLSWMAFVGVIGCAFNILPWMRRRVIAAGQPGPTSES